MKLYHVWLSSLSLLPNKMGFKKACLEALESKRDPKRNPQKSLLKKVG